MKKLLALFLALSFTTILGACSGSETTDPATEESPATTESPAATESPTTP